MRAALLLLVLPLAAPATDPGTDPGHDLIVMLAPVRGDDARASAARAAVAPRLEALGLAMRGTLADGLPRLGPARADGPFALDPARVLRVSAPDSAAAAAARAALADLPGIAWAEPVRPRAIAGTVTGADPLLDDGRQWGLENRGSAGPFGGVAGADIGARRAWASCAGGADVLLAVADTGIDPEHPEFAGVLPDGRRRLAPGVNVTLDPGGAVADSFGHGTPVAGVMAARTGEGAHFDSLGMAGVCGGDGTANPGCRLLPIKITFGRHGTTSSYEIARALLAASALGARALNLSFAGGAPSALERLALLEALARGCVTVAAAGNRGATTPTRAQFPGAFAADGLCVQAGASDPSDRRCAFSSYGPGLDVLAPGEAIWTTYMTYPSAAGMAYDGYVLAAGTSFAAPHVTGVLGLLAAARPELTDTDLQQVVRASARDLGTPGPDPGTGWGRLDAAAALASVGPGVGVWHGEAAADPRSERVTGGFTLGDPRAGERPRTWSGAARLEVGAEVALPDSFLAPVRVWPRLTGTTTARGDSTLPYLVPWAEVARIDRTSFALRGHLHHLPADSAGSGGTWLPVAPGAARIAFTVLGRVDRAPTVALRTPGSDPAARAGDTLAVVWSAGDPDTVSALRLELVAADGRARPIATLPGDARAWRGALPCAPPGPARLRLTAMDARGPRFDEATDERPLVLLPGGCGGGPPPRAALVATPNPARGRVRIEAPWPGTLRILDVAGRRVARRDVRAGALGVEWDGRDPRGRRVPPGLYLARLEGAAGRLETRMVRLE